MKRILDLNGQWRFIHEMEMRPTNNHNLTGGGIPVYAYPQLNRRDWQLVGVPDVWSNYGARYEIYEGVCWYCRSFTVEGMTERTKAQICFKGVTYRADVFVNGKPAGWHESSYTEFTLDVTGLIQEGENFIAVMVDNRPLITKWPNDRGYFSYGGIHRDVFLELLDGTWLDRLEVTPELVDGTGEIEVRGVLNGKSGSVEVALDGESLSVGVAPDEEGRFSFRVSYPGAAEWSPECPKLSRLTVSYDGETYFDHPVGFRSFKVKGGALALNSRPCRLNGCCYVYDSPRYGLVMTEEQLRYDLSEMKAAGVNAIRTHYPMDDKFYDMCDEMGFLVWIEPTVYCYKPSLDEENTAFARQDSVDMAYSMAEEMIFAARRHPSVVIYGIGNECNVEHPEAIDFFRGLAKLVRDKDGTRLVGFAALYGLVGEIGELLDVIGLNSYWGWYDKISDVTGYKPIEEKEGLVRPEPVDLTEFHRMVETSLKKLPERLPILLTEFGADSIPGYHSSADDLWSEEYHAKVVKSMVEASRCHSRINGTFVFSFTDYTDPCKPFNGYWRGQNLKGMLSYQRDRKEPFYALREAYTKK